MSPPVKTRQEPSAQVQCGSTIVQNDLTPAPASRVEIDETVSKLVVLHVLASCLVADIARSYFSFIFLFLFYGAC